MKSLLIILLCILPLVYNYQIERSKIWKPKGNSIYLARRMILLMQTLHRNCIARHKALNHMRFMYEESPHYEFGYIMGEIIERYRKMISHVRRRLEWKNVFIFDLIRRVQVTQYLYFEIYNLQRMMHEIELKYKNTIEYKDIHNEVDMDEVAAHIAAEQLQMESKAIKQKQNLKRLKKMRKKFKKLREERQKFETLGTKQTMWPIEYGWDIGPYW